MDRAAPTTALVVASNRQPELLAFLEAWGDADLPWDHVLVVEDNPRRTFRLPSWVGHHAWESIEADPAVDDPLAFSRRDSAIKCYGLFRAATELAADVLFCLDDDCLPMPGTDPAAYVAGTLARLAEPRPRWVPSIPGYPTRGLPYERQGTLPPPALFMNLWAEVCDLDGPQSLASLRDPALAAAYGPPLGAFAPPADTQVIDSEQLAPFCGMSFAARREVAPLLYFPRQGEGSPYRRFDDIWCGVLFQLAFRRLGLRWGTGGPLVRHSRASDPFTNTTKEAPGIHANEWFWSVAEGVDLAGAASPLRCVDAFAASLAQVAVDHEALAPERQVSGRVARPPGELVAYLAGLGENLATWAQAFRRMGWETDSAPTAARTTNEA